MSGFTQMGQNSCGARVFGVVVNQAFRGGRMGRPRVLTAEVTCGRYGFERFTKSLCKAVFAPWSRRQATGVWPAFDGSMGQAPEARGAPRCFPVGCRQPWRRRPARDPARGRVRGRDRQRPVESVDGGRPTRRGALEARGSLDGHESYQSVRLQTELTREKQRA